MPYFDYNASTPLTVTARETWLRANDGHWHNPSSPYRDAAKAKIRLDSARERIAEFLGAKPSSIVFNSGATEGIHATIAYLANGSPGAWMAVSRIEHPAVLAAAQHHFADRILWIDTKHSGTVCVESVEQALAQGNLAALAVMAANNETGVVQPWQTIAQLCLTAGVPYLCDAAQWLGKLPAAGLGAADWVIGAAHKFGGPKGVGFLKCAAQADSFRSQLGGEQEAGRRGGTENLPGIWSMAAALAEAEQKKVFLETERLTWREEFERTMRSQLPGISVVGQDADRLWNTVGLILPSGENHRWVLKLDRLGFQVSTGSACATGKAGPSPVLTAMGYSPEEAKRMIRISSGWETTRDDWRALAEALSRVSKTLDGETSVSTPA